MKIGSSIKNQLIGNHYQNSQGKNTGNAKQQILEQQGKDKSIKTIKKLSNIVKVVKVNKQIYNKSVVVQSIKYVPPIVKKVSDSSQYLYTVAKKQKMIRRTWSQKVDQQTQEKNYKNEEVYLNENIVHFIKSQNGSDNIKEIDTRFINNNSEGYPYNCIGLIVGQRLNKKGKYQKFIGTGFLISPNLVLTVAHNVFFKDTNSDHKNMKFYPKLHGVIQDYQQQRIVIQWRIDPNYINSGGASLDYALIKIDEPVKRDRYIMIGQDYPKLTKAQIYGYPWDKNEQFLETKYHQFGAVGQITSIKNQMIIYRIDTMQGQSGSPIAIEFVTGLYFVVGIHVCYNSQEKLNSGTHLNNTKVEFIKKWIDELSPESKYNIIDFKEIQQLPQFEGKGSDIPKRLQQIELYLKQIEVEEGREKKGDKLRWLLVQTAKKYRINGKYEQCISYLNKAISVCQQIYQQVGEQEANIKNQEGITYCAMKKYQQSTLAYLSSLLIYMKLLKGKYVAAIFNNIGNNFMKLKKINEAEKYYQMALSIDQKYYCNDQTKFSIYYTNFANFLMKVGKYMQAEQLFEKALKIKQKATKISDKEELPKYYFNLATCHFMLGKIQESFGGFFKTINMMIKLNMTEHQKFKKYLKGFKIAFIECLKAQTRKNLLVLSASMMEQLIKFDQQFRGLKEQAKWKIEYL